MIQSCLELLVFLALEVGAREAAEAATCWGRNPARALWLCSSQPCGLGEVIVTSLDSPAMKKHWMKALQVPSKVL